MQLNRLPGGGWWKAQRKTWNLTETLNNVKTKENEKISAAVSVFLKIGFKA